MKHSHSFLTYYFKHLKVRQKYSATRRIFNSLLGVWKCGQTRSFVFDILHNFAKQETFENLIPLMSKLVGDE